MEENNLPSLEELSKKLKKAKKDQIPEVENPDSGYSGFFRISVELFSGIIAGGILGYLIDKWFHTSTIFFLIFFFLGAVAGGMNIYRLAKNASQDTKK